jgi:hypothetical protein
MRFGMREVPCCDECSRTIILVRDTMSEKITRLDVSKAIDLAWLKDVRPGDPVEVRDDRKNEGCSVVGVDDVHISERGTVYLRLSLGRPTDLGDGWVVGTVVRRPVEGMPLYVSRTGAYISSLWTYRPMGSPNPPKPKLWVRRAYTSKDVKQISMFDRDGAA